MSDFLPRHAHPAYPYTQHSPAIHSDPRRTSEQAAVHGHSPVALSPLPASHQLYPAHYALVAAHPTAFHSLLQLSCTDSPQPSAALASFPAIIVSDLAKHASNAPLAANAERVPAARPVVKKPAKPAPAREQPDGSKGSVHSVPSSAATMTPKGVHTAVNKRDEGIPYPRASRPSITSHHSNSVPSTPLQVARQYESRSRSPSPNGGLGSHSPRSACSEANGTMPTLRPGRVYRCKFETNAAFGRRRIPYISSDILEKAKEEQKKTLNPQEDEKLSGDMRELYDRLLPTLENAKRRDEFVKKLQMILEKEFPGNEFKVHVFGSSGNMLYTSESDVDICIQTPMKRLEEMHMLAEALARNGMEKVVCVPQAKVRIVKVWDPVLKLACDMNVNNMLALENTRMIKTYIQIDERVRPLAMIIKYWTKQRILNDAALGGTISSYTWICMILNFLQTRDPPILPALHNLPHRAVDQNTGSRSDSEFADDLEKLVGFGKQNKESWGQLLFHFFRLYGHELDYEKHVISVRHGRLLTREEKNWHLSGLQKEARNRLCVEEPFNTERNLGNSADDFAWRGIHLEIRRAFELLADGQQLDKACEQYEFPPEEKSTAAFKKPQSTKPTLSSASSGRGGRGPGGHRGGRGGFNQKGNSYGRRASSGAQFGANRPPFLNSPPIASMPGQEYFSRGLNEQLHDQLFQQYQFLEMQSNSLRAQLAAQQRAQQQAQAAHLHAHAVAQAQHARGASSASGSPQKSPHVNGRSSPRLADAGLPPGVLPQGFLYHYPGFFDPSQASATVTSDGSRTNPSSPSLTNSVPGLRRQAHRASNASETGSIRSQSQPARGVPPQPVLAGYAPMPQFYDPATFAGYPIARSTQEAPAPTPQPAADTPYSPMSNYPESLATTDHGTPKEYVGYYVEEHPPPRPLQDYMVPQIPTFNELAQRRRRVSPEITQPLLNTALRRVSRSPSPLGGHMRSYSIGVTPPSGVSAEQRNDRIEQTRPPVDSGPVIVNGSFPTPPRESRSRSGTVDALPPADVGNPSALGIYVSPDQYRMAIPEQRQHLILEDMQRQKVEEPLTAGMANLSVNDTPPMEMNGLARVPSGLRQSFPALPETWMNYELGNGARGNHTEDVSPTRTQGTQWRATQFANGVTPLDTINAPRAPPQEIKSATLPLLSPVFETRTPSPTASRQQDIVKLVNGTKGPAKENNQQPRRASHTPTQASVSKDNRNQQKANSQANEKSNKSPAGGNNNSNVWTQARKKKKKSHAGSKANEAKTSGEPLPANVADRKGG